MSQQKIIILIGISGSGKSTIAHNYVMNKENPKTVIVCRDSLRMALFGYRESTLCNYYTHEDVKDRENEVTKFHDAQIWSALENGYDVIADSTHLKKSYINSFKQFGVELELKVVDCRLVDALERDITRTKCVGSVVINRQYKDFKELMSYGSYIFDEIYIYNLELRGLMDTCKKSAYDQKKFDCIVWDIDGTTAIKGNRGIFDLKLIGVDEVNKPIKFIYDSIKNSTKSCINIFCSGREDVCRAETEEWLDRHGFKYDYLYMRKAGDARKDYLVKMEFWKEIQRDYNIQCLIDDRHQVVSMGRKLGLTVLQVSDGNF